MSLSIIIPCLNEYNNLSELLPFLIGYSKENTEIIVSDSAYSEDNTPQLCQQHKITYKKSEYSQRAHQMNEGAKLAKGNALLFLHADVRPPDDFVAQIADVLSRSFDFGLFSYKFDSNKWILKVNAYFTKYDGMFCGGGDQCHFMTKALFQKTGGYDTSYDIMEDFEFFHKIKHAGHKYKLVNSKATVSARKYKHNSYLSVNLTNLMALHMFRKGESPDKIKAYCDNRLK